MMGQNILCNNVLKITANRNKCMCQEHFLRRHIAFCTAFVYVSERYFHPFIFVTKN